jgi:hypothetical protein
VDLNAYLNGLKDFLVPDVVFLIASNAPSDLHFDPEKLEVLSARPLDSDLKFTIARIRSIEVKSNMTTGGSDVVFVSLSSLLLSIQITNPVRDQER